MRTELDQSGQVLRLIATGEPEERLTRYEVRGLLRSKFYSAQHLDDAAFMLDAIMQRPDSMTIARAVACARYALARCPSTCLSGCSSGRTYRQWQRAALHLWRQAAERP